MTNAATVRKAAALITTAARDQWDASPHHGDFYALALAARQVLDALDALNSNIGIQLAHYQDGRRLRTDTDRTPAEAIAAALDHRQVRDAALRPARQARHAMGGDVGRPGIQAADPGQ